MQNGIDFELVLSDHRETAEEFRCKICLKLSFDMVLCNKCEATYCKHCLDTGIQFCFKCEEEMYTRVPNKIIMRIMAKIKIRCKNSNCKEIVDYDEFYNHLIHCVPFSKKNSNPSNFLKIKLKRNIENENGVCSQSSNKLNKINKPILKEKNYSDNHKDQKVLTAQNPVRLSYSIFE